MTITNNGDNANTDNAATNDAATQDSSTTAEKLFDAGVENDATKGDTEVGNDGNDDQNTDTSNTADEADKDSKEDDKSDKEDGDESKEGDEKDTGYEELKLPEDLPEGVEVDEELFASVKEIGEKHKVPAEAMQELIDAYANKVTGADVKIKEQWADVEQGWKDTANSDKEIGGDNYDLKVEKAKRAISVFGTPELKEALEQTRMGNHPELIRVFSRIGEKITEEGNFDRGSGAGQRSRGDVLFDNS